MTDAAVAGPARYTVTDYLLDRLAEFGAERMFGVPGDFTLGLLDHVEAHPVISWVGTANELGAGYAADGYARLRGIGALCTTFGVGELSAINAVAGSFAEHVPVVHIVGAPTSAAQNAGRALHHSLGDGDFRHFFRMSQEVTAVQAVLTPDNACAEIDRVLLAVRERRLPGYLLIAADVGEHEVQPPTAALPDALDLTSAESLAAFEAAVRHVLAPPVRAATTAEPSAPPSASLSVAVLADLLVQRMGAVDALHELLATGPLPHATLLWGRRVVDESAAGYLGTYAGSASDPAVLAVIEGSDVLVLAGVQFTDLTSGFFSQHFEGCIVIRLDPHRAAVAGVEFAEIDLVDSLRVLTGILSELERELELELELEREHELELERELERDDAGDAVTADETGAADGSVLASATPTMPTTPTGDESDSTRPASVEYASAGIHDSEPGARLGQHALWDAVSEALRPGDLVIADQGTSFYGMGAHRLPHDVVFVGQPLWASIGYSLPALLGAALAAPERRPVLLIGDGAAQLTIAELGTMIRLELAPIVVVVNNDGYTVERAIHAPNAAFNDITAWNWTALPQAFARGAAHIVALRAETVGELHAALEAARQNTGALSLIEAVVPKLDVPPLLSAIAAAAARANASTPPGASS